MNILFVNFTDIFGGGEVFLKKILNTDNKDIKKFLLTPSCDKLEKDLDNIKIIHGYCRKGRFISLYNFINIFKEVRLISKVIKEKNIECIFLNGRNSYYLASLINSNVRKIGVWHGSNIKNSKIRNFLNTISFNALDKIIVVSECQKQILSRVFDGKYDHKVEVVYLGVDLDEFNREIEKHKLKENSDSILVVARLEKLKGHLDLLQAIKRLKESFKNIQLNIVGEGDQEEIIKNEILKMGLEKNVNMLGFLNPVEQYANAAIFVLPSYTEAFPTVNIEAMAAGIPIVTTNVGGIEEAVIHKRNGYITTPGNIDEFVDYITILLNDKNLRKDMGEISKKDVENKFTIDKMCKSVYDILLDE